MSDPGIQGLEGLSQADLQQQLRQGARFVVYSYAMSFILVSFKRTSAVHFIKAGESAVVPGLPYVLLSFLLGWWGFPGGLIYTPWAIIQNLSGGTDVTPQMLASLGLAPATQGLPEVQVQ